MQRDKYAAATRAAEEFGSHGRGKAKWNVAQSALGCVCADWPVRRWAQPWTNLAGEALDSVQSAMNNAFAELRDLDHGGHGRAQR